jgi:DNA-binding MarR family transcriptional regulator
MFKKALVETEIQTKVGQRKAQRMQERFLKGPIPLRHIARAAKLPGQSLSVYIAIHHQTALTRREQVTLPKHLLTQLGVSRDAKARALKELHKAGLVQVEQHKGRASRVGLLAENSVVARGDSLGATPLKNHQWSVIDVGIKCLSHEYEITKSQLTELREPTMGIAMWPLQMAEKSWVDIEAFLMAYENALIVHNPPGVENIDIEASFQRAREIAADRDRKKE